jgi:hypothetical protein
LLEQRGFSTRRLSAGGAPYVYAELSVPGAAETNPPFSPTLLDGPLPAGGKPRLSDRHAPEFG